MIETAKFNVVTAYSGVEALEIFQLFPALSGVVLDAGLEDIPCRKIAQAIKASQPGMPVIVITSPGDEDCPEADFLLETFEPANCWRL